MEAGVGEHGGAFREFVNGSGSEFVGVRHRTGRVISGLHIVARQYGLAVLMTALIDGRGDALFHLGGGIIGQGVAEILHDVETISASNHAQPDHVVGRVEQVRAMGRGKHQMFVSVFGVVIERHVFSLLIELEGGRGGETYREGGLTIKLVRELAGFEDCQRVGARGLGEPVVERERWGAGLLSGLIG